MHLGIVAPLPHVPCGAAEWVASALPLLEQHAEITCYVENVEEIDPQLRANHHIRNVDERHDGSTDMLVYHIGNNPHHGFVFDAIMEGPTGLVEVHDGSLHHFVQDLTLGRAQDPIRYVSLGEDAHGYAGRRLAELRWRRYRGVSELFLYDYLRLTLDRSLGAIVHSEYAEQLVQMRCPRVHTWKIPLHAPELPPATLGRLWTDIGDDTLLIAHLGFVTFPKRPFLYLEALRRILDRGLDAHLVFVGSDETQGQLVPQIKRMGLADHVTITGYLETSEMERWVQAVDVIVNLRAPHVGESSGSLSYGLSAGKPVVVQPVGSWAEFPEDVVVRIPVTDDDSIPLAATLFALGQDPALRAHFGAGAARYAATELNAHRCAERLVHAAQEAASHHAAPPSWVVPSRVAAARMFLESGAARINQVLAEGSDVDGETLHDVIRQVSPARPGARLLAIDVPPRLLQLLGTVWGYEIDAHTWGASTAAPHLGEEPGIPAFSYVVSPLTISDVTIAEYDVIIAAPPAPNELWDFTVTANRLLTPQGALMLLTDAIDPLLMDAAGFSPRVHYDSPGLQSIGGGSTGRVTIGTKATLPALSFTATNAAT